MRFDVDIADSATVRATVADGRADLGLSGVREDDSRLEFLPFTSDELVVVVAAHHRFASLRRVPLVELADERLVAREPGSGTWRVFRDAYLRAVSDPDTLRTTVAVGSSSAVVDAVAADLGIGVVSESALPGPSSGTVGVRFSEALTRTLWLVLHADRRASAQREAFVQHVRETRPQGRS